MKTVVILGASDKPERYSNKVLALLVKEGYAVLPVHPILDTILGIPVVHDLSGIARQPDVLTVYVNQERSTSLMADILALAPRVAIFNPGAENEIVENELTRNGTRVIHACSLVLLTTGRFEKIVDGGRESRGLNLESGPDI